jgi:hypothetical protein
LGFVEEDVVGGLQKIYIASIDPGWQHNIYVNSNCFASVEGCPFGIC